MGVEKMSVSFDLELGDQIKQAAAAEGMSTSAWLAEAARARLRNQALADAIKAWEEVYGPITEEEMAEGDRLFEEAAKLRYQDDT
jgi:hypothetical protein